MEPEVHLRGHNSLSGSWIRLLQPKSFPPVSSGYTNDEIFQVSFFSSFLAKPLFVSFPALQVRHISQSHRPSFDHTKNIWWKINLIQVPILQFFKTFYDLLRLRVKYLPEHPILTHPPLYAPFQCNRPNVTPIYSHGPNYSSVCIHLHILSSKS
jgi:hypothetical protein